MSYRSLHISLLVLLLALDAVMINLSGVAAFWLRCRTAVFDTPDMTAIDLRQEEAPFFGVTSHGRYRLGPGDAWRPIDERVMPASFSSVALVVDLGVDCRIDEIDWAVARDVAARTTATFVSASGDEKDSAAPIYDTSTHRLKIAGSAKPVSGFVLSIGDGPPIEVGDFSVKGANVSAPALFSKPVTDVPERPYWYLLWVWNAAAFFGLVFAGAYRITRSLEIIDDFCLALKAVGMAAVTVIVILFLYRGYQEATYTGFEFSRLVVIFGATFATILLTGNRAIVDAIHSSFLKRGVGIRRVIVVGAGALGQNIVDRLRRHYWLAYEPVAFVDDNPATHGSNVQGLLVMGGTDVLPIVAREAGTNEVIVALPNSSHKSIRDIVGRCKSENIKFHILPDLFEVISSDVQIGAIDGVPILDLDDTYLGQWDRFLKRGFDVLVVLIGGVLLLPVWILIALSIKLSSRGPVLYTRPRVGENGKTFNFFKFRTMQVASIEEEVRERKSAYADLIQSASTGKIVNDRRVTWIGDLLRRYRLDELPQILNVLRGEMSLVGPRPPIPYEIEDYNSWHMERLKGMPGLTGLWQVSGGPDLAFEEMVKLDIYYFKNWTLWMDFKILLKTIPVVFSGKGA